jgi:hypothetical protein
VIQHAINALAAFKAARSAGREPVFSVLRDAAPILAVIDHGQTLWAVYRAVMEVERWWAGPGSVEV